MIDSFKKLLKAKEHKGRVYMNKVMKSTIYYAAGLFVYLLSQWLMSILVVRLSGSYEEAGVFSIALSVTNVFYVVSTFSMRNYQVVDINGRFSDGEYVTYRIVTCVASVFMLIMYLIIMQYSLYTAFSVVCYMLIKVAEAMIDVLQGIFQKAWRLDIVCKSLVVRGIINLIVFSAMEWLYQNLVISLLSAAAVSLICGVIFDAKPCVTMFDIKINFKNKKLLKLFLYGMPVFIHGLLSVLIYNTPRIIAQKICGEEQFGYYSSVAAPTVIIQLAVSSIFSPCISVMAEQYVKRDRKLLRTVAAIQGIIIIIGLASIVGFSLLGDFFLKTAFGEEILSYNSLLIPSVIGALLIATTAFISSVLIVTEQNITMAVLEAISFAADLILSIVLILEYGLQGINYALILSCILFIITGYLMVGIRIRKSYISKKSEDNL